MRENKFLVRAIAAMTLLSAITLPVQDAFAKGGCGFGFESRVDLDLSDPNYVKSIPDPLDDYGSGEIHCYKDNWYETDRNDGFTKAVGIEMWADSDDDEYGDSFEFINIYCVKKKFEVYVGVDYAQSVGWSGSGQVRFDNGSPKNLPYYVTRSLQSILLKDSKSFVLNFAKAKKKVTLKIGTVEGTKILAYPKTNFLYYRTKFKKAGCTF
jgi:hypothetical protein